MICIATYRLINDINNYTLLSYQFINTYDNINDNNISILIFVNLNENQWVNGGRFPNEQIQNHKFLYYIGNI